MNFFRVKETTYFKNNAFGEGELLQGETYFAYTRFAEEAVSQGFGEIINIDPLPFVVIDRDNLGKLNPEHNKILLYFSGGYGDAMMLGSLLPSIEKMLGVNFDLCCAKEKWFDIFRPLSVKGSWVSYPPSLLTLNLYDGVITDITSFFTSDGNKISPISQICRGFGLDPAKLPRAAYKVDNETWDRLKLPFSSTPRLGVNLDSNGSVKSYPSELYLELIKKLKVMGLAVFLLGRKRPDDPVLSEDLAFDLRDRTTVRELAAIIKQMDFVIGVDSFVCHMANALDVPALVLLSTTSSDFFSLHSNINCVSSKMKCAPCFHAFDSCPGGNKECLAFYHNSISPGIIASSALKLLVGSLTKKISSNSEPAIEVLP